MYGRAGQALDGHSGSGADGRSRKGEGTLPSLLRRAPPGRPGPRRAGRSLGGTAAVQETEMCELGRPGKALERLGSCLQSCSWGLQGWAHFLCQFDLPSRLLPAPLLPSHLVSPVWCHIEGCVPLPQSVPLGDRHIPSRERSSCSRPLFLPTRSRLCSSHCSFSFSEREAVSVSQKTGARSTVPLVGLGSGPGWGLLLGHIPGGPLPPMSP